VQQFGESEEMTIQEQDVRSQLENLVLTDALNSRRMADALREGMTAALLKKADTMEPRDLIEAISKIESIPKMAPYREILDLLAK
jgi:DNA-binding NarL/FixJ family response regulator